MNEKEMSAMYVPISYLFSAFPQHQSLGSVKDSTEDSTVSKWKRPVITGRLFLLQFCFYIIKQTKHKAHNYSLDQYRTRTFMTVCLGLFLLQKILYVFFLNFFIQIVFYIISFRKVSKWEFF